MRSLKDGNFQVLNCLKEGIGRFFISHGSPKDFLVIQFCWTTPRRAPSAIVHQTEKVSQGETYPLPLGSPLDSLYGSISPQPNESNQIIPQFEKLSTLLTSRGRRLFESQSTPPVFLWPLVTRIHGSDPDGLCFFMAHEKTDEMKIPDNYRFNIP